MMIRSPSTSLVPVLAAPRVLAGSSVLVATSVVAALAAGCGSPSRTVAGPDRGTSPEPAAQLDAVAWIAGDWLAEDERTAEHWVPAAGVIWGVALADDGFEVLTIDAGGDGGALRLTPAPGGKRSVSFTHAPTDKPSSATFTNAAHDDPTSITYEHRSGAGPDPEALRATLEGPGGTRTFAFTAISDAPPAPAEVLAALGAATATPTATSADSTRSWRSLPEGHHAATLTTSGAASHVIIWKHGADGAWARVYEDRRP